MVTTSGHRTFSLSQYKIKSKTVQWIKSKNCDIKRFRCVRCPILQIFVEMFRKNLQIDIAGMFIEYQSLQYKTDKTEQTAHKRWRQDRTEYGAFMLVSLLVTSKQQYGDRKINGYHVNKPCCNYLINRPPRFISYLYSTQASCIDIFHEQRGQCHPGYKGTNCEKREWWIFFLRQFFFYIIRWRSLNCVTKGVRTLYNAFKRIIISVLISWRWRTFKMISFLCFTRA